jgi:hypothetical protein
MLLTGRFECDYPGWRVRGQTNKKKVVKKIVSKLGSSFLFSSESRNVKLCKVKRCCQFSVFSLPKGGGGRGWGVCVNESDKNLQKANKEIDHVYMYM